MAAPLAYVVPTRARYRTLAWQRRGLQQTASGYGRKLLTTVVIQVPGSPRWYRVYVCQFSNSGTAYIVRRGQWEVIANQTMPTIEPEAQQHGT